MLQILGGRPTAVKVQDVVDFFSKPRVVIEIDNRLRLLASDVSQDVQARLESVFAHKNPKHFRLKKMGFKAWKEPAVVRTFRVEKDRAGREVLTVPRGGMPRLRAVLQEHDIEWRVVDRRTEGDKAAVGWAGPLPEHRVELWEHQAEIVESVLRRENCLVRAPTGSGKTTALLAAISRAQLPALVMVWDSGLLRQWRERIGTELGLTGDDVGVIGGGQFRLRPITLAMQQSLYRLRGDRQRLVSGSFGLFGADEVQRAPASTFLQVIDRFPARYRIGMSADERRKDQKEFLAYDLFGVVETDVSTAELAAQGRVHEVELRVVPTDLRALWYVEAREAENEVPDFGRLLDELTVDADRNRLVVQVARGCAGRGEQVLVFCHRVDHCRRLDAAMTAAGLGCGLMVGEDEPAYVLAVDGLRSGKLQVGVGTFGKIGQGLDLPAVAAGIVASPCHNNRPFYVQVSGRLSRVAEGKSSATLYYLWDRYVHGLPALYNLRRWSPGALVLDGDGSWVAAKDYITALKGRR